ncbi:MAG TPA: hypothetical protein ENJ84_13095 [Gammaproteobacteria bacterium]|nr:hypothetical protein [Gammaproteobacteria bacterium]
MAFKFKPGDIKRACGAAAYQKGVTYWKQGKVLFTELLGDLATQQIVAEVSGRNGKVYQAHVEILEYEDGECEITGECTCPVELDCKHVAAALLQVLHDGTSVSSLGPDEALNSWIDELKVAAHEGAVEDEAAQIDSTYRLLYLLDSSHDAQAPYAVKLLTQKVRLLKKGGYGKPTALPLEKATESYYSSEFLEQADKDVAQLLTSNKNYYYYNYSNDYILKRELGALALHKMLQTGRCHWTDKDSPPLRLGAPRQIAFEWQPMGDGHQLEYKIEPPVTQLLRPHGFWYLDLNRYEAGPLQHPSLTPSQIEALLKAPVIPETKLEEVSRQFLLELPEYDLPAAVQLDYEQVQIENEPPIPHLVLHSIEVPLDDGPRRIHSAKLSFIYQGAELEEAPTQLIAQVVAGKVLYRVTRDLDAENSLMESLFMNGMSLIGPEQPKLEWFFPSASVSESAGKWHDFIEHKLPVLEAEGWKIDYEDNFHLRFDEADEWQAELESDDNQWFSLTLGVELDGQKVNLLPLLVDILAEVKNPVELREYLMTQSHFLLPMGEHRWLKVPSERLLPIFDTLVELYDQDPLDDDGRLMLSRHQGLQINDLLNNPQLVWHGAEELQKLNDKLRNFHGIEAVKPPRAFNAELRGYQQQGLNWLQFLRTYGFNGILADDMGLGKTIQTLSHLLKEKQCRRMKLPCLVIAPTSLMGNWRREAANFTPTLKVLTLHGYERHKHFSEINDYDIVLTTYPLLRRDKEILMAHSFYYIVLDEAQSIKNPKSQTSQVVYELKAEHRLCLSGTPMENHIGELWSMFHFLMPGFLGTLERFNRLFRTPIEKQGDDIRQAQLSQRIAPFLLRRTKSEVASELPDKTEMVRAVALEGAQRDLYESIRLAMDKKVRAEIQKKGLSRSHIMILDALLKLRQCCCDPRLVPLPQAKKVKQSSKLSMLMEMVPEMLEEGRKILIFSQFTTMLGLIEEELKARGIRYSKLTGQTRKRDEAIEKFQGGEVPVFLISLKAGGVGLNLTAADTVIHYDPWWNPAVENQATDRAHRIGQDKAVFVYKLITEETVEDKILALQKKKSELAESIYSGRSQGKTGSLTSDDLTELFRPLDEVK